MGRGDPQGHSEIELLFAVGGTKAENSGSDGGEIGEGKWGPQSRLERLLVMTLCSPSSF